MQFRQLCHFSPDMCQGPTTVCGGSPGTRLDLDVNNAEHGLSITRMRTFPLSLSSSPSLSLFRSTLGPRRPASLPRGIQVLIHLKQWIWRDLLTSIGLQTHLFSWLRGCSCHPTYTENKTKSHLDSWKPDTFLSNYIHLSAVLRGCIMIKCYLRTQKGQP